MPAAGQVWLQAGGDAARPAALPRLSSRTRSLCGECQAGPPHWLEAPSAPGCGALIRCPAGLLSRAEGMCCPFTPGEQRGGGLPSPLA